MTTTSLTGPGIAPTPVDIDRYRAQLSNLTRYSDQCLILTGILRAVVTLAAEAHTCDRHGYCTICTPLRRGLAAIAAFDAINPPLCGGVS